MLRTLTHCLPLIWILQACGGGSGGSPSAEPGPSLEPPAPAIALVGKSASPSDVITIKGANFGPNARVLLNGSQDLAVVGRSGTDWMAARLPSRLDVASSIQVADDSGASTSVALNRADPFHLDALQVGSNGRFRVYGRYLKLPLSEPHVTVDGRPARVLLDESDESQLTVVSPAGLESKPQASISIDNGVGFEPVLLNRPISQVATEGDAYGLGIGWTATFNELSGNVIDVKTDVRLASPALCDGISDDTPGLQAAVDLAAQSGGVVQIPSGNCVLRDTVELKSNVIVQGAGRDSTIITYFKDYPFLGGGLDRVGLRAMTLSNSGSASEGLTIRESSRVLIQGVAMLMGASRQLFLSNNVNMVVAACRFVQQRGIDLQGPYNFTGTSGLAFMDNETVWGDGSPTFFRVHDSVILDSRFLRDSTDPLSSSVVHSLATDFAHRIAIVGNRFGLTNGPIADKQRNDGEAILTEGGGSTSTGDVARVTEAATDTLRSAGKLLDPDPFGDGALPENYGVTIVGGTGSGQMRRVLAIDGDLLRVDQPWHIRPDSSSRLAIAVWGLEKALIKGNAFIQIPRGIWLYNAAVREVDIIGNTFEDGGGVYLRAAQHLPSNRFDPIYDVNILRNSLTNLSGEWLAQISIVFVRRDPEPFGTGALAIAVRGNQIETVLPNRQANTEDYVTAEGFTVRSPVEVLGEFADSNLVPRVQGTILQANRCIRCERGFALGKGADDTLQVDNVSVN